MFILSTSLREDSSFIFSSENGTVSIMNVSSAYLFRINFRLHPKHFWKENTKEVMFLSNHILNWIKLLCFLVITFALENRNTICIISLTLWPVWRGFYLFPFYIRYSNLPIQKFYSINQLLLTCINYAESMFSKNTSYLVYILSLVNWNFHRNEKFENTFLRKAKYKIERLKVFFKTSYSHNFFLPWIYFENCCGFSFRLLVPSSEAPTKTDFSLIKR